MGRRNLDFSRAVLEQLYQYRLRKLAVARGLWLFTGLFGGHRFYLDRPVTGIIMFFTFGGLGLWWLIDLALLGRMTRSFNSEQIVRHAAGDPPRQLSFMPPLRAGLIPRVPAWAAKRGKRGRLPGDMLVVAAAGFGAGTLVAEAVPEPAVAALALVGITLLGARWDTLSRLPVLRVLDRWNHRLRLFYYFNDPGGPLRLFFRGPLAVFAMARKRARVEAFLYLKLGAWFTMAFVVVEAIQYVSAGTRLGELPGALMLQTVARFTAVYTLTAPIGATLTKRLLLDASDRLVWWMAAITLLAFASGATGGFF